MRLLLVEDSALLCDALAEYLRLHGHEVHRAEPANAVAMATQLTPQAICLDYYLPEVDGLTLLERLRAAGLTCLAVLSTAAGDAEVLAIQERLPGLQPAVLLRKPYDPAALVALLGTIGGEQT